MSEQETLDTLNANAPHFLSLLGGKVIAAEPEKGICTFEFNVSTDYCHSVNIIQGGFVTAMLDATMSHAVFAASEEPLAGLSTLEIKTTFLEASRAGRLRCEGLILKMTYKTAFLEARLYNDEGTLTAVASSVAKISRSK